MVDSKVSEKLKQIVQAQRKVQLTSKALKVVLDAEKITEQTS